MAERSRTRGLWPFGAARAPRPAERLLGAVAQAARAPALYGEGRVPDTLDGRLEAMFLHAALALMRLRAAPEAGGLAQAFADLLFRHLDEGLRETGVGDLSVPKTMKRIAGRFYGRLQAYDGALAEAGEAALVDALARNVFNAAPQDAPFAATLAAYVRRQQTALAAAPAEGLLDAATWATAP
jgi:cytochrome b pre-mRNA-processing protein 3